MAGNLKIWEQQLQAMKRCRNITELVSRFGEPHHRVQQQGFEIWHYPLGVASGMLYSIHVSVWPDQRSQIYLFFEPTDLADSPLGRSPGVKIAGVVALLGSLLLGYLSIYVPISHAMHHREVDSFFMKLAVGVPALLFVGMVLTFFGARGMRFLGVPGRESRWHLGLALLLIVLGFFLLLWVANRVEHYQVPA
jgi:hypothetical protein